jgi:PAT family beta-lactamase induction signal transducer AmpG
MAAENPSPTNNRVPSGIWSFSTYFAEGFPYEMIRTVMPVFWRAQHVALENIGLTSLLGIPWTLKFLWGPLVDEYSTKRAWLLWMQGILAVIFLLVAFFASTVNGMMAIVILMVVAAFIAATHDIAIDGFYMAALDAPTQAQYVGFRVMAYRIAMIFGSSVIIGLGANCSWPLALGIAGAVLGYLTIFHAGVLPFPEIPTKTWRQLVKSLRNLKFLGVVAAVAVIILGLRSEGVRSNWQQFLAAHATLAKFSLAQVVSIILLLVLISLGIFRKKITALLVGRPDSFYAQAFASFMNREHMALILGFVLCLRAGEYMQSSMISSYFVDLGLAKKFWWISSGFGLPATIMGAICGGLLIRQGGFQKWFLPLISAQNLTMLIYTAVAAYLAPYIALNTGKAPELLTYMGDGNLALVVGVHVLDNFTSGLGTSVLTVFLLRICLPQHKAAHYAIASGLMSVFGIFGGVFAGQCAQHGGYALTYLASFGASLPGFILGFILWYRKLIPQAAAK